MLPRKKSASLLRIHVPNDNRLFPGRQETQVADFREGDHEWQVDQILSHVRSSPTATFEVKWTSGDVTWLPSEQLPHLLVMKEYLNLLEIKDITDLPLGNGALPSDDELINCHLCRLANDCCPHSMQPCPSHNNTRHPGRPPRLNYDRISHSGEDFIFRVNEPYCSTVHVLRAHLRCCLEFSVSIRSQMIAVNLPPMPIRYNTIA